MPRFAANLTWLFPDRPFAARFEAAARAGFDAVEILFPYDEPAGVIRKRLDDNGLSLVLHNAPPGDWRAGERGFGGLRARGEDFRRSIETGLETASILGSPRLHVLAGDVRGASTRRAARALFADRLARAAEDAAKLNVTLTVEPLNPVDAPNYLIATTQDALDVLHRAGAPNVRLQFDAYHRERAQGDTVAALERHLPSIAHVQIAGVPDRHEPDVGRLPWREILSVLDAGGYGGAVGLEYAPAGKTEDGLARLKRWREGA